MTHLKSDSQNGATSSNEGKDQNQGRKHKENSYLEWSCNDPANQESLNSASTATTGTNKSTSTRNSSNGNGFKEEETSKKPNITKRKINTKLLFSKRSRFVLFVT